MATYDSALALPPGHIAGPPAHRVPPPPPRVEWKLGEKRISGPPSRTSSGELKEHLSLLERMLTRLQKEYHLSERKLSDAKSSSSYYASMLVRAYTARRRAERSRARRRATRARGLHLAMT